MLIHLNITKSFDGLRIFDNLKLSFDESIIYSIVGPSGCGKSTLLNIISSIDTPTEGTVNLPVGKKVGYLLQDNIMLPWRTVKENISLGTEIHSNKKVATDELINFYLNKFELSGFEDYYPDKVSGGMAQRASLIRCLVTEPDILLMDEPFNSLDFELKMKIQVEVLAYQKRTNATIIMVTHDLEDAIALSDEVLIFSEKPATIKNSIKIELGINEKDPILARKSEKFRGYFSNIWDTLKIKDNKN
jgi:NitT/TauT family transport system ATP-binding protein